MATAGLVFIKMAIVEPMESVYALSARGKFGYGRGYGGSEYGRMRRGASKENAGIYQRKAYGVGVSIRSKKVGGRYALSRMRFYGPTESLARINDPRRITFANAISAWHGLTSDEKAQYSKEARRRGTSGYHLYISRWLKSHRG